MDAVNSQSKDGGQIEFLETGHAQVFGNTTDKCFGHGHGHDQDHDRGHDLRLIPR